MTLSLPLPTIQLSPQQLQQLLAQFQQYTAHQQQQQQQQQPAQPPQPQQHHGGGSGSAFQPPSYNPLSFQQTPSAPPAQPAPAPPVQPQPQSFSSSSPPFNFVMQPSAFSSPSSGQNGPFSPIRQPQPQHQQHQQQQQQQSPASSAQPSTPSSPPQQLQFYPSMPSPYYAGYMPQQPQQLYAQSAGSSSSSSAAASQSQSASSLPSMTPSSLSFVPNSGVAIPTPVVMASASTAAGSASSYSAVHHARNKQARHNPVMGPVASASAPAAAASSLPSLRSPSAGFPSSVMSNPNIVRAIQSGLVNTRPAGAEAAAAAAGAWSDKSRSVSRPTSSSSHPPFELLKTESKRPYATLLYSVNRRMLPSYISKRPSAPAPASPTSSAPSSSPASPASTSASGSASASSPVSPAAAASPLSRSPDMTTIKIRVMTLRVPPPNALPLTSELFFVAADISAIIHSRKSNIAKGQNSSHTAGTGLPALSVTTAAAAADVAVVPFVCLMQPCPPSPTMRRSARRCCACRPMAPSALTA